MTDHLRTSEWNRITALTLKLNITWKQKIGLYITYTRHSHFYIKMIYVDKQKGSRPISAFYQGESRKDSTLYIKAKWEAELKIQIQEEEWYHMCETQCTSTNSLIWREFCWKNLTRYFITPKIKSRQLAIQQDCWRLCGSVEADHAHIFWNCIKIRTYWQNVNSVVKCFNGIWNPKYFFSDVSWEYWKGCNERRYVLD